MCVSDCFKECVRRSGCAPECVCVSPFLIMCCQSWLRGMGISLTLPKSHNADPPGGRISHQPVAKRLPAPWRRAEIMVDAIRRWGRIKLGAFELTPAYSDMERCCSSLRCFSWYMGGRLIIMDCVFTWMLLYSSIHLAWHPSINKSTDILPLVAFMTHCKV